MAEGAQKVEGLTYSVRVVALDKIARSGVLVLDSVTGRGVYVEAVPLGSISYDQTVKVMPWAKARFELIQALMSNGQNDQIQFLPPLPEEMPPQ